MNIRNCPIQLASTHRYKHMMEEEELTYDVRAGGEMDRNKRKGAGARARARLPAQLRRVIRDRVYRRAKPECVCICVFRLVELGSSCYLFVS